MNICQVCGGLLTMLGRLGKLVHWRCRNCAMQFSSKNYDEYAELDAE